MPKRIPQPLTKRVKPQGKQLKPNPCKPIPKLNLLPYKLEGKQVGCSWLTRGLCKIAQELFSSKKMPPRHIRKTLGISGRQMVKAIRLAKKVKSK